jgi:chromosome segregation ATPase
MKNRIGLVGLGVVALVLAISLIVIKKQTSEQHQKDAASVETFSNQVVKTTELLESQRQVNAVLDKDLDAERKTSSDLSNRVSQVSANLAQTSATLAQAEASLKASQQEVARRDAKIAELETQNQALDKQASDLNASITNLNLQIADTQKKLAASEGDKAFLEKELKRLMSEKAELERQFNDLTVLRAQVAKLKEEMNIARRIEWIREGIYANSERKGAQKLMQGAAAPQVMQAKAPKPAYDLNVEVKADGSVKVIPPLNLAATNAAPAK